MTAEIAVLNRQGVALAADSAVTVNYPGGQKIYNSVNKLFMLSKFAPVGTMVYGVADLTGVPWETIIKAFRKQLGPRTYPRLEGYAQELISFINGHKVMFTEILQQQQVLGSVLLQFRSILRQIDQTVGDEIAKAGEISDRQIRTIVNAVIRVALETWESAERLAGVPPTHSASLRRRWAAEIDAVIDLVFEKLPLGDAARRRLRQIAGLVFTADLFPDNVSGVVVAGFGEDEYFPAVIAFDVEGVLLNFMKVRANSEKSFAITQPASSAIIPFAQGEMVSLFMEGIDPTFRHQLDHALERFSEGLGDALITTTKAAGTQERTLRRQIKRAEDKLSQEFFEFVRAYSENRHIQPVVSAVANLPKEELASMAETLVSLTSFKRRVTQDPETVGGPIDVAVISKGDGFIWMDRKHYFQPGLNHHFFANYYR